MDSTHTEAEGPAISIGSSSQVKGQSPMRIHCEIFFKFNPKHPDFNDQFPYARCRTCKKKLPAYTKLGGTTNILHHLKYACVGCPIYEGKKRVSGQSTLSQDTLGGPLVPETFNQKRIERLCYEMVIRDQMPFRVVEGVGFRNFVHDLQPKFKIPDRKKVTAGVFEVYVEERSKIMSVIGNQRVTLQLDLLQEVGLTIFQLAFKRQRMEEEASEISNKVGKYLIDPLARLTKGFNLNEWWKTHEACYVVLSKLAKDLFSIPSSTVASENTFSLGGRVVDLFRASLTPKTVEALVCTSDWIQAEEFNFYKEPTDEEVEFYKELEELEPRDAGSTTADHN